MEGEQIKQQCKKCGYIWVYKGIRAKLEGIKIYVCCPMCHSNVPLR